MIPIDLWEKEALQCKAIDSIRYDKDDRIIRLIDEIRLRAQWMKEKDDALIELVAILENNLEKKIEKRGVLERSSKAILLGRRIR